MAKSWAYTSYQRAAKRHYMNCIHLIDNFTTSREHQCHVASDIYYVGGYVIECSLKFFIMNKLHMNGSYSLDDLDKCNLKTHDLYQLWIEARKGSGGLTLDWTNLCLLTKNWTEQIRYDASLPSSDISKVRNDFRKDLETVYKTIFQQY